jgi:hypothetical protein
MNTNTSVNLVIDILNCIKNYSSEPEILPELINTETESEQSTTDIGPTITEKGLNDFLALLIKGPDDMDDPTSMEQLYNTIIAKLNECGIYSTQIENQIKTLSNMMAVPFALKFFFPNLYSLENQNVDIHIDMPNGMNRFREFSNNETIKINISLSVEEPPAK